MDEVRVLKPVNITHISRQCCGVGVEIGVVVGLSRLFWPLSESELESVIFWPRVAGYHPSTDGDFGPTVMNPFGDFGRQEEKESGSVEIKLKHHLVIEFGLKRGVGDSFRAIAILV